MSLSYGENSLLVMIKSMEIGHASEAQRKSLNMHQFCAAVLVVKLLCFNKNLGYGYLVFGGVKEGLQNKNQPNSLITNNRKCCRVTLTE